MADDYSRNHPEDGEQQSTSRRRTTPPKKRRRRRSNGGAALYVVFVIGVATLLAALGWVAANDVLALNKAPHSAVITLPEEIFTYTEEKNEAGETVKVSRADMGVVVDDLEDNGVIQFKWVFRLYASFSHAAQKLAPGTYELDTNMDYRAIITNMGSKSVSRITASVTVPEGYTVDQIFTLLQEKGVSTADKLRVQAADYNYKFSFLQDIPLGDYRRLEGFLFPDTYEFYLGEDPKTILNKMLANFDRRFTQAMRDAVAETKYSIRDILNIAAMIEKETDGTDRQRIASVIYNRLDNPSAGTMGLLNIDATIQYILPERKEKLTATELAIDNPYNTYKYKGLPPAPIANPGMAAINAAMDPEKTSYYYYALGDDNVHHFFKTLREQQNFTASQKLYQNG